MHFCPFLRSPIHHSPHWLCMYSLLTQQSNGPLRRQTSICTNIFITLLLPRQHINQTQRLGYCFLHKHAQKRRRRTTGVLAGDSFASTAGFALIERQHKIPGSALSVFGDNQESKKADCWGQFDHLLLGMGSPLPDWNRLLPGGPRPHWTGEVGTVIISWANPKSLPISLFPTQSCGSLDMSLAAYILPCRHASAVKDALIY